MRAPKEQFEFIHELLTRAFDDDLHAKPILSLANGTLGVMTGAALAVSLVGQSLATARGLVAKSALNDHRLKLKPVGSGLRTESPDTRRLNDASGIAVH